MRGIPPPPHSARFPPLTARTLPLPLQPLRRSSPDATTDGDSDTDLMWPPRSAPRAIAFPEAIQYSHPRPEEVLAHNAQDLEMDVYSPPTRTLNGMARDAAFARRRLDSAASSSAASPCTSLSSSCGSYVSGVGNLLRIAELKAELKARVSPPHHHRGVPHDGQEMAGYDIHPCQPGGAAFF